MPKIKRWLKPLINIEKIKSFIPSYIKYLQDLKRYSKMDGAETIKRNDLVPYIYDKTTITSYDSHYFYQDIWAYQKIYNSPVKKHIDIGSRVIFVGLLTVIKEVEFIDIRPLKAKLNNFNSINGNILSIPYPNNSIKSLSCLHVAEHIGLGRYGDTLDPLGTYKATKELSRVLAPGGTLYFSLPIGKPRVCFNGHRIHSIKQIRHYFEDLELLELSGVDDSGNYIKNIDVNLLDSCEYGCGFFLFTKK